MNPGGQRGRQILYRARSEWRADSLLQDGPPEKEGVHIMATLLTFLHRSFCTLRGHDRMVEFQSDRILLVCMTCGHQTHGWEVARRRTRQFNNGVRPVDQRIVSPVPQFTPGHEQAA
jgi:hypothetical protein